MIWGGGNKRVEEKKEKKCEQEDKGKMKGKWQGAGATRVCA
jgi:hypothetical protein